jgi:hypothetical protein
MNLTQKIQHTTRKTLTKLRQLTTRITRKKPPYIY